MKRKMFFAFTVLVLAGVVSAQYPSVSSKPIMLDTRKKDFTVGVAAYSFNRYTVFETIEKIKECGGDTIEFYLSQKLSPEHPDVRLLPDIDDKHIARLHAKMQAFGIRPVNAWFSNRVFGESEEDVRKLFDFAKKLKINILTGEPPHDRLDLVEKMVKEYNILVCLHNHARSPNKPEYRNWDPEYMMNLIKDRDPRIGLCVDTGAVYRSGMDAVEFLKIAEGRVYAIHLSDVKEAKHGSPEVLPGEGVGNVGAVLTELKRQGFSGPISIEYGYIPDDIEVKIKAYIDFVRAHH